MKSKKIPIKEILKPVDIVISNDYIVIQNERLPNEDCFFVYEKNEPYDFLYSFGRIGAGNGEFIAPKIIRGCSGNRLSVFDNAHSTIKQFELKDGKANFIAEVEIQKGIYPLQEIAYVNDSILMFRVTNNVANMTIISIICSLLLEKNISMPFIWEGKRENYNRFQSIWE